MVLEHVAHDARFLVVLAARLHPTVSAAVISTCDTHRRFHSGSKMELAKRSTRRSAPSPSREVVDAVHLVLGEQRQHELIERVRRGEAAAERLLHDDARPRPLVGSSIRGTRPLDESSRTIGSNTLGGTAR
jgi:hypothetical protein